MSINNTEISGKKMLLYIFIAALLLRSLFFFTVSVVLDKNLDQDFEYGIIARSLIAGEGYSVPWLEQPGVQGPLEAPHKYRPSAYHLPVYPLVLAGVYYFVNSPLAAFLIIFIQIIVAAASCMLIYLIALKLFSEQRIAVIAGGIMMLYPTFIIHTARLIPETVLIFWLSLMLLYLLLLRDKPSYKKALVIGVLMGMALLTSNVVVPMIPFIVIWLLSSLTVSWKQRVKIIILTMLTAFMVVSPWLVRNYIVFREFPLMKANLGHNLWLGNNPRATGTFYTQSGEFMGDVLSKDLLKGQKLSELEQDKELYAKAMAHIKEYPLHYISLSMKRFYYFVWFPPDNLLSKESILHKKISKIPFAFILVASIIGAALSLKKYPKDVFLIFSIILSQVLLFSLIIVGHPRYRMTIEPYMILFTAFATAFLFDKYSRRSCR